MALGFGLYNGFPFEFGGGDSDIELELMALLDAYAPGWDSTEGTENYAECVAYANAVAVVWACNKRLANQLIPLRMLENLRVWEESCKLRPAASDTDVERRKRVAAKLRGIANNSLADITEAVQQILGNNFEALVLVPPAQQTTYWPGINPGPPGFEWSSTRAIIGIQMSTDGLNDSEFYAKRTAVVELLDAMIPAWMTFTTGTGSAFVINQGVLAQTLL